MSRLQQVLRRLQRRLMVLVSPRGRRHAMVGPPELWRMKRQFQIDFLRSVGLEPHHRLVDLGCGTLRGGIPLIAYLEPGRYWGIEARADALAEGRKELEAAGLVDRNAQLIACADPSSLSLDEAFDFVWAFSVLIHMDDEHLDGALSFVARHLAPTGRFYANVNLGTREPSGWQGFPVLWRTLERYREVGRDHGLDVEEVGTLRELGHESGNPGQDAQVMLCFTTSAPSG